MTSDSERLLAIINGLFTRSSVILGEVTPTGEGVATHALCMRVRDKTKIDEVEDALASLWFSTFVTLRFGQPIPAISALQEIPQREFPPERFLYWKAPISMSRHDVVTADYMIVKSVARFCVSDRWVDS